MSSGELFALLDRAQNGDDAACEQVLQENARADLEHRPAILWLRGRDG